jgi:hypothetical protein
MLSCLYYSITVRSVQSKTAGPYSLFICGSAALVLNSAVFACPENCLLDWGLVLPRWDRLLGSLSLSIENIAMCISRPFQLLQQSWVGGDDLVKGFLPGGYWCGVVALGDN